MRPESKTNHEGNSTIPMLLFAIPSSVYIIVGELFIALMVLLAALILIAVWLAFHKKDVFPRFTLFMLNLFYQPSKLLFGYLQLNPLIVDEIGIALMNSIYNDAYGKTAADKRLLLLPQCLRSLDCPAKISSQEGVLCEGCGKCGIAGIKKICDARGMGICIAPGGEFVKRAIREKKPQAAIGIACQHDLYETMRYVTAKGVPMIGVLLSKTGCVMTEVDWEEVERNLEPGSQGQG